jgi:DUF3102 family protein
MTRAKKKAPQRESVLDRITARVRTALRSQTKNVIEVGKLLIESRKHLEHGEWLAWLTENFDLSPRTAQRYVAAAEYVAKNDTVSHFANLSASVLYRLAEGDFNEQEEAAILAASRERRIGEDAAWEICEALAPTPTDSDGDHVAHAIDDGGDDTAPDDVTTDAETEAILDGPPPAVPPPAPIPPPIDFALRDFDEAISALKRLMTKSCTQFAKTIHSAHDLEGVESFVHAVMKARRQ